MIGTIIVGFVVGVLAKLLHPGRDRMGFIMTTLLGIGGAIVATYLGQVMGIYAAGQPAGFLGGIIGAIILLAVYGRIKGAEVGV